MSLDSQSILEEYKSLIRGRAVAWEHQVRLQLVTDDDVKKIKAIEKVPKEKRVGIVEKDASGYAELALGNHGVLRKSRDKKSTDFEQYILMWIGDLLDGAVSFPSCRELGR